MEYIIPVKGKCVSVAEFEKFRYRPDERSDIGVGCCPPKGGHLVVVFILVVFSLLIFFPANVQAKTFAADAVATFDGLSSAQRQTIQNNINSHYTLFGHQSVGDGILGNYLSGCGLPALQTKYNVIINQNSGNAGLHDFYVGSNGNPNSKINGFVSRVKSTNNGTTTVHCAFFKLCYVDIDSNTGDTYSSTNGAAPSSTAEVQALFNYYQSEIAKLKAAGSPHKNIVYVHCTIPLRVSGYALTNQWRIQFNNLLKQSYNGANDYIFDIADIEATDTDGVTKSNYLLNKYRYDDSHPNAAGDERLAKALVVLLGDVYGNIPAPTKPTANFSAAKTSVNTNETVTFTNSSSGSYTSCSWNFGDNSTSTVTTTTVTHKYTQAGTYSVALTVTNSAGSNTMTRTNYITVQKNTIPPGQSVTKSWGENAANDYKNVTKDSLVISYVDASEANRLWVRQSPLQQGVIYFDLSAIAGATVTKAELTLKTYYNWSTTNTVDLYAIEDLAKKGMWNETAVTTAYRNDSQKITWSNTVPSNVLNAISSQKAGTVTLQGDNAKLIVDITNVVSQWVSGIRVNQGLLLQPPAGVNVQFYSRETAGMANNGDFQPEAPSLKITYSSGATPGNNAPTANAGVDQSLNEGVTVSLDGSKSSDPDTGDTLTYSWKQTAGATVSLSSGSAAKPTFTAPTVSSQTTLTFELTVTDNHQAASKDTVNIIVNDNPASGVTIDSLKTYGAFETGSVEILLNNYDTNKMNETARGWIKKQGDPVSSYKEFHPFVRYDGNHMIASLFGLALNTTYDVKVELSDPDSGKDTKSTTVTTRPEYTIPSALRNVNVSSDSALDTAIKAAQPGDHILVAAGNYYDTVSIYQINGTAQNPIVIRAANPFQKPHFYRGVQVYQSSHLVFDNLEVEVVSPINPNVTNVTGLAYGGVDFRGCHHVTITNCYIHDCDGEGYGDTLGHAYHCNIMIQHNDENVGTDKNGYFLIMNNIISDEVHPSWVWDDNDSCQEIPGHTYVGIKFDFRPGGYNIIRGNYIYGSVDGICSGGDEGHDPPSRSAVNVLNSYPNQNLDIYDNVIYHCKDDCLELDGHTVNGRVFRNRLGESMNAVSIAPVYPGPMFLLRNTIGGFKENGLKMNTAVGGTVRDVFLYHNTWVQPEFKPRSNKWCFYRGMPGQTEDIKFRNNIFVARQRIIDSDISGFHRRHDMDYDCLYSYRSYLGQAYSGDLYVWGENTGDHYYYTDLAAFRAGAKLEAHGIDSKPLLNTAKKSAIKSPKNYTGDELYANNYFVYDYGQQLSSPTIDKGVLIPGINDNYKGSAPDIGADEYYVSSQPKPDPKPDPQPDPKPEPKPDPQPQPKPDPKPQPKPKPDPQPQPQPDPSPDPQPNPQPDPEPEIEPASVWYLAEGTTKSPFNEWILIQNPGVYDAAVKVVYMLDTGDNVTKEYKVGAGKRFSIHVNDIAELKDKDVSAKVTADTGIVVERSMYCAVGGNASIGVTQPAKIWYLAEGTVKPPFNEWILIQNPGATAATVWVTYMPDQGENITKEYQVKASSRYTIHVNDISELKGRDVSAKIESNNEIIVERAMYWDQGTHASIAVSKLAYSWYLAEGTTRDPFHEWILIQNPGTIDVVVRVSFMPDNGDIVRKDYTVRARSRYTIHVNDIEELKDKDVSAKIEANGEIIVERAMYWSEGAHNTIGVSE